MGGGGKPQIVVQAYLEFRTLELGAYVLGVKLQMFQVKFGQEAQL